ncbi:MAG: hypothetical protein Q7R76_06745 [Candidatus Woesearchaeota archaeon]|nr:hypothetical protein [Candidatus Woesearchaeota archaeon]
MSLPSMHKKHRKKHFLISIVLALCVVLLAGAVALDYVSVPYTTEETYPVEETYEDIDFYNSTEEYSVLIPDLASVTEEKTISINTPRDRLESHPLLIPEGDCLLEPYDYDISYSPPAKEHNTYDPVTHAGYFKRAVRIMATICNQERKTMSTDLLECHYAGATKVSCLDHLIVRVPAKSCLKRLLVWITDFDPQKTIQLEMGDVSRKLVCKNKFIGSNKNAPEYSVVNYFPLLDEYQQFSPENTRVKTRSGYLGTPKNIGTFVPDEVGMATTKNVQDVVTYHQESRPRNITLNRTIMKTRSVDKKRTVTKSRTLLEELQARYSAWCTARNMC